jgi:signal transduction histidine kinase
MSLSMSVPLSPMPCKSLANKRYRSKQADAPLSYSPTEQLPPIIGDPDYLSEALEQIIDNAYRHTPADGQVCISTGFDEGQVWVKITDTGEGISLPAQAYIFETFWRQEISHSLPGFGLGLAIAQKIVHMHKGSISLQSELGKGSEFSVSLPRALADSALQAS